MMTGRQKGSVTRIQTVRKIVQFAFLATVILTGIQFTLFVAQLEAGKAPSMPRPPGIEAFLPISSLISLKYWLVSGHFNRVHPSGLIILLAAMTTALLLKRGFCSWVCPFGLLTEYLNRLHKRLFGGAVKLPRWLDHPLRSLKYLLLAFFLWAIVIRMDARSLQHFIYSPYNMVADIKMLHFFRDISAVTFWVLAVLLALSILIRNFWCRYLCPYGALLGGLSRLSIFKIRRNGSSCTQCRQCTRACPADIAVHSRGSVTSDECHGCLNCVAVCPVPETLHCSLKGGRGVMRPWLYAAVLCAVFVAGSSFGRATGLWHNEISEPEYRFHIMHLDDPIYGHNRGRVPVYNMEAWLRMMRVIRLSGEIHRPVSPGRSG